MQTMPIGARGSFTLVVAPDHLANRFKDAMLPPVLATPVMIMVMENAALNAMKPYLDAGESALGTRVDVRHLAATPVGRLVTGEAEIVKVDGRRLEFTIRALDGDRSDRDGHARADDHRSRPIFRTAEMRNSASGIRRPAATAVRATAESQRDQLVAYLRIVQQRAKRAHGRTCEPRLGHDEIVALLLHREESEVVLPGHGIDRDAPVRAPLRYGGGHRVVRFRLHAVA